MPDRLPRRLQKLWQDWLRPFALMVLVLSSFRSAVADWNDVPTGSMNPTIVEGDRIVVNKLAYDLRVPFTSVRVASWSEPERGDIVTCWSPEDDTRLVKRVVATPGDTVELRGGVLFINGARATYQPVSVAAPPFVFDEWRGLSHHAVQFYGGAGNARDFGPITVGPDEFFVLGDNRDNSRDSRYFGPVRRAQITGRAWAVAFSLDPHRGYVPRFGRTFSDLN